MATNEAVLKRWKSWAKDCHEELAANPEVEIYDALSASQQTVATLQARVRELERFHKAHDVVEDGVLGFDLHNEAVMELRAAHAVLHGRGPQAPA